MGTDTTTSRARHVPAGPPMTAPMSNEPTAAEVAEFTGWLRDLSARMARLEPIPQQELDAFHARKAELFDRIGKGGAGL